MNSLIIKLYFNFLKNKEFNNFYLSVFIMTFAQSLVDIFVPIYLYNLGYQIHNIILFYFLISLFFLFFAYPCAKITSSIGAKHSILISIPFLILYYLGLIFIEHSLFLFIIIPCLYALRFIFYNYGYHLNYLHNSQKSKRGQELALFGILTIIATISAPLIGGLIATFNFALLFIISSVAVLLGSIPLFLSKDNYPFVKFTLKSLINKTKEIGNRGNLISFSGYAIESSIGRTIWPIFLIITLTTLDKTGFIVSFSIFISLIAYYFLGKITDKVNKLKLLKISTFLYFLGWIARLFADTSSKILFIDSYKNLTEKMVHLPWMAQSYNLAVRADYFEFIVNREIIFNMTRVIILPMLAYIFWINYYPFIISFITASIFSLGYAYLQK